MTTTQSTTRFSSHPLKDVVNTNDDPTRCANCLVDFDWFDCDDLAPCCGKAFCDACTDQNVRFLRSAARGDSKFIVVFAELPFLPTAQRNMSVD